MKIIHISLFSGMGGFDLAAEWMGWINAASCEINPFGTRILNYYWPNAYHHQDVKDFTYETVNVELCKRFGSDWRSKYKLVISGGFPCQPYSAAGKRLGKEDDRHLWPEMLRIIREFQPNWVVGENVRGLTNWNGGMVFDEVQSDLEASGYEITPFLLPACAVNAPHRRDRIWFIAHARSDGSNGRSSVGDRKKESATIGSNIFFKASGLSVQRTTANTCLYGHRSNNKFGEIGCTKSQGTIGRNKWEWFWPVVGRVGTAGFTSNTSDARIESLQQGGENGVHGLEDVAYPKSERTQRLAKRKKKKDAINGISGGNRFSSNSNRYQRRKRRLYASKRKKTERYVSSLNTWDSGRAWENFPTQPPVCFGDDGLPTELDGITISKWRNESIKAAGNAIVPQVVYQIFKAIEAYENAI